MKIGDLVASPDRAWEIGIVVEMIDDIEVPPAARVLWEDGVMAKDWKDDLEVVNESR